MSWAKLDDKMHSHPKIETLLDRPLGLAALGLWTVALSYCADHLTDGKVTEAFVRRRAGARGEALAELLVLAGMWERAEGGGWSIHDYHEHNPRRVDVLAKREEVAAKRASAGRSGGHRSAEARKQAASKVEANGKQAASKAEATMRPVVEMVVQHIQAPDPDPTRPDHKRDLPTEDPTPAGPAQVEEEPRKRTRKGSGDELRRRGPCPGLARMIAVQRELGGEALDTDPATAIAYNRVRARGDDAIEAAIRKAWRIDSGNTAVRSLRWLLQNLDRYLAPGNGSPPARRSGGQRQQDLDLVAAQALRELEAEDRERRAAEAAADIRATEVTRG